MEYRNLKRIKKRIWEEIDATKKIAKVTSWSEALITLIAKVDIQIMNHNGYKEYSLFKKHLLQKHKVMMQYFERTFNDFLISYDYEKTLTNGGFEYKKNIWICWWQGEEQAPELVKKCIQSIRKNAYHYNVVIITEENYRNYVSFPEWTVRVAVGVLFEQVLPDRLHAVRAGGQSQQHGDHLRLEVECIVGGAQTVRQRLDQFVVLEEGFGAFHDAEPHVTRLLGCFVGEEFVDDQGELVGGEQRTVGQFEVQQPVVLVRGQLAGHVDEESGGGPFDEHAMLQRERVAFQSCDLHVAERLVGGIRPDDAVQLVRELAVFVMPEDDAAGTGRRAVVRREPSRQQSSDLPVAAHTSSFPFMADQTRPTVERVAHPQRLGRDKLR